MKSTSALKTFASRAFHYIAFLLIMTGFTFFDLTGGSNCWAQQTVTVKPGDNLQALVNAHHGSTTFSFTPGIYYLQSIVPKSYDSFVGQTGVILSGAALLTNFSRSGSAWVTHVQVAQATSYPGLCASSSPACTLPEDVFFDNTPKTRVTSLSAVGPGKWFLNYNTGTAYLGDNPAGHTVEISLLAHAFNGAASSVTINNLVIEKYACVAGSGAVDGGAGSNYWAIGGNEVRYNHAFGIQTGDGIYIHNNNVHHNGELGIGGRGTSILVQSNQISYNNYAGYSIYNEAGGAKFAGVRGLTFQYNRSYHNSGPGFWVDIDSQNVLCNANQFTANQIAGVMVEISDTVTVSNNYIWNDGFNPDGSDIWWGAGILISTSSNVSVFFNSVSNSMNGIAGIVADRGNAPDGQPYSLKNVNVNSNSITQNTGRALGIAVEGPGFDNSVYNSWNNQFQHNTFTLSNPTGKYFYWLNVPLTLSGWTSVL